MGAGILGSLLGTIGGIGLSGSGTSEPPSFWLPGAASTTAQGVDRVFALIYGIALVFFLLIVALMVVFVVRYRRRAGREAGEGPSHNTLLELAWTIVPLALVVVIFWQGFKAFLDLATPPANAYEVLVNGQKWKWTFTYPNGYVDDRLHVPVDTPVRLVLSSEDVIHSFFVPSFRMKMDAVPGRYTKTWFRATTPGQYDVFCAEYCGTSHSDMRTTVVVHPAGEFEKWLEDASNLLAKLPPAEAGARLYATRGCAQCHSVDGRSGTGPTFQGLFGHPVPLREGGSVIADENYLRESIVAPEAKVAAGYQPVMPTYKGRLKDGEITAIIEYLKTLEK
jgi:cytochrome c oxidase subunit 2